MKNTNKKTVVYTAYFNHAKGFTLISSLLRILMISIMVPILTLLLTKFSVQSIEETLSIQQLFFVLQAEINEADEVVASNKHLTLYKDDTLITIKQYGSLLRRTKNNGYEVYHRNIKSFTTEKVPYGVKLKIITTAGGTYERTIVTSPS